MPDPLETVLRLVEEGHLDPEEAGGILAALDARSTNGRGRTSVDGDARPSGAGTASRSVRIEVMDAGRSVVNLRLPASLGELAMLRIPGLSEEDGTRIREALRAGLVGDLVRAIDERGSGVRIAVE
jgi:hypothetical protein